ncbi:MAG: HAMP domain-containing sensor histidine kinase [Candidatus Acidiferrum sp.]
MQEATGRVHINSIRWSSSGKKVLVVLALVLPVLLAGASLRGRPSYALTAFGDLTQFFLLATTTLFFAWKGLSTRGTHRAFWLLMGLGFGIWSINMFLWVYFEVWRNRPVPSIPIGEFLLFIKLVPMIAALALEPDNDSPGRPRLLGFLDLTSLLVYWTYVYLFWAMAYMLAGNDLARYNRHSDIADAVGNQIFLLILVAVAFRSQRPWRGFYLQFLGATATYSFASILINNALGSGHYYTGSIYDVPLTAAMTWFCVTAITCPIHSPSRQPQGSEEPKSEGRSPGRPALWAARLSMLASLSTPVIGLWLVMSGETQEPVRHFRILLTLFTMLLATILFLLKQDLLNFKLAGNLRDASLAYLNLKRFEDQLVQNEKLASLGKLVARVAHEINRAMVAVGKDVEVLSSHPTADTNRQKMTAKIGESARRTNSLVESMLSFAQEMPVHRSSVNVRPLLESAVNLTRAERRHNVRVEIQEEGAVPMVEGDANQLVQVFLHIIANAIDAMEGSQAGLLTIAIRAEQEYVEIEFMDTGLGLKDPPRVFDPFYTTKPVGKGVGLGLSTCYGIIRQHGGEIDCQNRPEGGAVFKLVIPAAVADAVEAAI